MFWILFLISELTIFLTSKLKPKNKLLNIITKDNIPLRKEQKVYARSKSPVRISFGGGGSDTSSFFEFNKGAVINSTISIYTHTLLKLRLDKKIIIHLLFLT